MFPKRSNSNKVIQCNIRNITERKEVNQKLQDAVIFQQRLIDALPLPVFYMNAEGRYLGCNHSFENYFGQPREQITGKSLYELFPKEIADLYQEKNQALLRNPGIQIYETTVQDGSGAAHQVIFHKATFPNTDGSVGLIGAILDITDRKRAEVSSRESEERCRALFDRSLDLVYIYDFEGRFIDANDAALNRLGYQREEIRSMNFASLLSRDQLPLALEALQEIRETGVQTHLMEFRVRHKNGSEVYVETQGSMVMANGLPVAIQAIARDITERKRAEESLRVSEEQYRLVIENAKEAIFIAQDMKLVFANDATMAMTGYPEEILTAKAFTDFIHPDDLSMVVDFYVKRLKGGTVPPVYSFRIIARDGTIIWCELNAAVIQWQGKPATLNFLRNITERKRTEDENKQSFARMRKALSATVHAISTVVELKDPYTFGHQRRVADLSRSIAREMGLSADRQDFIRTSTTIHDIGKIAIPSEILSKPTKLTDLEFNLIKTHARSGYDILKDIVFPWPVADVVLQHHERMNGSGYPQGLKGNDILLEARILAVSDVVESMASHRPYRPALGIETALDEIRKNKGILYDIDVVDACMKLFREKDYRLP